MEEGGGGGEDEAVPGGRGRGILKLMGTGGVESAVKLGMGHWKERGGGILIRKVQKNKTFKMLNAMCVLCQKQPRRHYS